MWNRFDICGIELIYVEQSWYMLNRFDICGTELIYIWNRVDICETTDGQGIYALSVTGVDFRRAQSNICLCRERKCRLTIWRSYTRFTLVPSVSPTNTHPLVLINFRNLLHTVRVCCNKRYLAERGNVGYNQYKQFNVAFPFS